MIKMNTQHIRLAIGMVTFSVAAMAHSAPVVDLPMIAGKSMKQVDQYLKLAPACSKSKRAVKCEYDSGRIEIVFIDGKADWITVNNLATVPFNESALASLGLGQRAPSFRSPIVIRWIGLPGYAEVSLFKGQSGSDYAYIKVKTP